MLFLLIKTFSLFFFVEFLNSYKTSTVLSYKYFSLISKNSLKSLNFELSSIFFEFATNKESR